MQFLSEITVVTSVVQALLSFLPVDHSRLGSRIEETLDLPLIQQQAENGALDIGRLSQFIIWTMGSLCAPCRDEDINKLKDITDIVLLLRSVMRNRKSILILQFIVLFRCLRFIVMHCHWRRMLVLLVHLGTTALHFFTLIP